MGLWRDLETLLAVPPVACAEVGRVGVLVDAEYRRSVLSRAGYTWPVPIRGILCLDHPLGEPHGVGRAVRDVADLVARLGRIVYLEPTWDGENHGVGRVGASGPSVAA